MPYRPSIVLPSDDITAIMESVLNEARAGQIQTARQKMQPLQAAQRHQPQAAFALLYIIDEQVLPRDAATDILSEVAESYDQDVRVMSVAGQSCQSVRDIDDLNSPPPDAPVFRHVAERLATLAKLYAGKPDEEPILRGLATAARMLGRQYDDLAESSHRKLTEIAPGNSDYHYNLGLFYKTRGRFADGLGANRTAMNLAETVTEGTLWNLGICATGAGDAAAAIEAWQRLGLTIEIGRFGLPEGNYGQCKVKLAERPLAERTVDRDHPGAEETIWIERLSPCHGVIRSVLYQDLGIDYGDVVLFDGAPITHHTYGETKVPVFPHLSTLRRLNYQMFNFAGTQETARQLANLSTALDEDAVIYSHSEGFRVLCANCWRSADLDHEHQDKIEKHVVRGRIAAPRNIPPARLLATIDKAVGPHAHCRVYAPDLCAAAELPAREATERRRFDLLNND